jgi:hypothetical protein
MAELARSEGVAVMSMATVNRAFAKALAGKATAEGCVMVWERGDDGKQRQRLTGFVRLPDGNKVTLTRLLDGQADLVAAAVKMANEMIEARGLGGDNG